MGFLKKITSKWSRQHLLWPVNPEDSLWPGLYNLYLHFSFFLSLVPSYLTNNMKGHKLTVIVIVSFSTLISAQKENSALASSLNLLHRLKHATGCIHSYQRPGDADPSKGSRLGRMLFPWAGVAMNEYIIRNLSKTLRDITGATTKAITSREKCFNSLAWVVSGNWFAPDHTLAEQGRVCPVVTTSCCTWENTSGEVEMELDKIQAQIGWVKTVPTDTSWLFGTYTWLPSGVASWFWFILQKGLNILFVILRIFTIIKLCFS